MKKLLVALLATTLTGCANPELHELDHYQSRFKQYGYGFIPEDADYAHTNKNRVSPQVIKMYTDKIARTLSQSVDKETMSEIIVTSYVDLDESLRMTNSLGNQLADYVAVSLKENKFDVIDIYTNDTIDVNPNGMFVMERTLKNYVTNSYILTGTVIYGPDNANINTKLIDAVNKKVIFANTTSMPNYIVKQAFPVVEGQDLVIKGN